MARTNLSLDALKIATNASTKSLWSCAGVGSGQVGLYDFAVDSFNVPTGTASALGDGSGGNYYSYSGSSVGSRFSKILEKSSNIIWSITNAIYTTYFIDSFSDGSCEVYFTLDLNDAPDEVVNVNYKIVDGFNINATNYNTNKSKSVYITGWDSGCFLPGTKIKLYSGIYVPIEKLKVGDIVYSRNFKSNLFEPKPIEKCLIHHNTKYYILNGTLKVTGNHKLWVNDILSRVDKIKIGDYVRNENYEKTYIFSIDMVENELYFPVYNLKIKDNHNYLAEGLLVHNKCPHVYSLGTTNIVYHGTVITGNEGKENLSSKKLLLKDLTDTYFIYELEDEISHIFSVKLVLELENGKLVEILPYNITIIEIVLVKDASIKLKFDIEPYKNKVKNYYMEVNGYYTTF